MSLLYNAVYDKGWRFMLCRWSCRTPDGATAVRPEAERGASPVHEGRVVQVDGRELVLLGPVVLRVPPLALVPAPRQQVQPPRQVAGVEVLRVGPRQQRHARVLRAEKWL